MMCKVLLILFSTIVLCQLEVINAKPVIINGSTVDIKTLQNGYFNSKELNEWNEYNKILEESEKNEKNTLQESNNYPKFYEWDNNEKIMVQSYKNLYSQEDIIKTINYNQTMFSLNHRHFTFWTPMRRFKLMAAAVGWLILGILFCCFYCFE